MADAKYDDQLKPIRGKGDEAKLAAAAAHRQEIKASKGRLGPRGRVVGRADGNPLTPEGEAAAQAAAASGQMVTEGMAANGSGAQTPTPRRGRRAQATQGE